MRRSAWVVEVSLVAVEVLFSSLVLVVWSWAGGVVLMLYLGADVAGAAAGALPLAAAAFAIGLQIRSTTCSDGWDTAENPYTAAEPTMAYQTMTDTRETSCPLPKRG